MSPLIKSRTKIRIRGKERQEKRRNRRPFIKRQSAVLQRTFRSSTEKNGFYEESAWDNWDPREVQQPFRPTPNRMASHQHVEAAADCCKHFYFEHNYEAIVKLELTIIIAIIGAQNHSNTLQTTGISSL